MLNSLARITAKMHYFEPEPTLIGEGTPPPLGACGASPHICQPPLFFHNSHTGVMWFNQSKRGVQSSPTKMWSPDEVDCGVQNGKMWIVECNF